MSVKVTAAQEEQTKVIKEKKLEAKAVGIPEPPKFKQPNLHFNLQHLLKKRKTFDGNFKLEDNIQGGNFPYYQYFSSGRSSIPLSARSTNHSSRASH